MTKVVFGMDLDDRIFPRDVDKAEGQYSGSHYCGPYGLIQLLGRLAGIPYPGPENSHLRMEQYRQLLQRYLEIDEKAFYAASFEADGLGTAKVLLDWRDELLLSGWDFSISPKMPARLHSIAEVEFLLRNELRPLETGFADRVSILSEALRSTELHWSSIQLIEPRDCLPNYILRILDILEDKNCKIIEPEQKSVDGTKDLDRFKRMLAGQGKPGTAEADGSVWVIRSQRDTEAAAYLATFFRLNPDYRPLCLLPNKQRSLDNACMLEGLPSLGIQSESLARPTLQLLKLVGAFLWKPIDPFKIMEFVSLSIQPIWEELARHIAETLAERPGIRGDFWHARINSFFEELRKRATSDPEIHVSAIENEYYFWFGREAHESGTAIPKKEIIEVFERLAIWASRSYEEGGSSQKSLKVLESQSRKIQQLLNSLPETDNLIDELRLERIVRTIYEPSPVVFQEAEAGHLPFVHKGGAILEEVEDVLWWDFTDNESESPFPRWYNYELEFLESFSVFPDSTPRKNALQLWSRQAPVMKAKSTLVLVIPDKVEGETKNPHPLFGDLQACFTNWEDLTHHLLPGQKTDFLANLNLPDWVAMDRSVFSDTPPFLKYPEAQNLMFREEESFSSLDTLFYYPYKWVMRFKSKLRKSPILSLAKDQRLKGNLAHRMFEIIFSNTSALDWSREALEQFIDAHFEKLLEEEGAVLMAYGKEPDREAFRLTLKQAAYSLISQIRENGWKIEGSEMVRNLEFRGLQLKGIADLVLSRGNEKAIVDLKWRGKTRYSDLIKNQEDLQLAFYSKMIGNPQQWGHTAYFIITDGLLIARNNKAFTGAKAIFPDQDHQEDYEQIWRRMEKTFDWRVAQLTKGQIEVRTENTIHELEEAYFDSDLDEQLTMKYEGARFDDYKALVDRI